MQTVRQRTDKPQALLHSAGNCIQYPVINLNGKEYENECISYII